MDDFGAPMLARCADSSSGFLSQQPPPPRWRKSLL